MTEPHFDDGRPVGNMSVEGEGYAAAFYEIAGMLGISARADSPANVWRDEMRPKLKAALALPTAEMRIEEDDGGWLPIESAPKDGTAVLLGYFRENFDGSLYEQGGEPIVARWIPERKDREDGQEAHWVARRERLLSKGNFSPTYWKPLPAPPKAS